MFGGTLLLNHKVFLVFLHVRACDLYFCQFDPLSFLIFLLLTITVQRKEKGERRKIDIDPSTNYQVTKTKPPNPNRPKHSRFTRVRGYATRTTTRIDDIRHYFVPLQPWLHPSDPQTAANSPASPTVVTKLITSYSSGRVQTVKKSTINKNK